MHAQHVKQLLLFIVTTEQRVEWRKNVRQPVRKSARKWGALGFKWIQ